MYRRPHRRKRDIATAAKGEAITMGEHFTTTTKAADVGFLLQLEIFQKKSMKRMPRRTLACLFSAMLIPLVTTHYCDICIFAFVDDGDIYAGFSPPRAYTTTTHTTIKMSLLLRACFEFLARYFSTGAGISRRASALIYYRRYFIFIYFLAKMRCTSGSHVAIIAVDVSRC